MVADEVSHLTPTTAGFPPKRTILTLKRTFRADSATSSTVKGSGGDIDWDRTLPTVVLV
jgi:hypothetical protein